MSKEFFYLGGNFSLETLCLTWERFMLRQNRVIKMKNISCLLAALLLAGILGLSAISVRAYEGFVREEIIITDMDPTDDIHGGEWMLRELEIATDPLPTSLIRGD